jgi:hypothetical protein
MHGLEDHNPAVEMLNLEGSTDRSQIAIENLVTVSDEQRFFEANLLDGQESGAGGASRQLWYFNDTGGGVEQPDHICSVILAVLVFADQTNDPGTHGTQGREPVKNQFHGRPASDFD